MKTGGPHIAVSGLHRGENPQPGAGIIRSLRRAFPDCRVTGLVYDVMESGIYAEYGPDDVHLIPYPSAGGDALFSRLDAIRRQSPFEFFIPTLDAEIELYVHLEGEFRRRGIRVCLPAVETLKRRAKSHLPALAAACGIAGSQTHVASDLAGATRAAAALDYPLIVKGPYYDARIVHTPAQLAAAGHLLSEWGSPVILQRLVYGSEFNVLGLGNGRGGLLGHCAIRKTHLSDKGKGLGGITVADPHLSALSARLIRKLKWPGPFEIELIREEATGTFVLIEINPRFPAWVDFPAMIGANFPALFVEMLQQDRPLRRVPDCAPGHFYLRHQIEVVGDINRYAALLRAGLLDETVPTPAKTRA